MSKTRLAQKVVLALVVLLVVAYVGVCSWLVVNEKKLAFPRVLPITIPPTSLALRRQQIEIGTAEGARSLAWIIPSTSESTAWLVLFHGSDDNATSPIATFDHFRRMGLNILAPEYPGYAGAPGEPSELAIEQVSTLAYRYLRETRQVPARSIILFGGSLGSSVAVDLASRVECGAVILHGAFSSGIAVGQQRYPYLPIGLLVPDRFESDKKIAGVKAPIVLVHSLEDDRIPIAQARKLYDLATGPKRFVEMHGTHRTPIGDSEWPAIVEFLNSSGGFHLHVPPKSIATVVGSVIDSDGIDAGVARYHALRDDDPKGYNFAEYELDSLGHRLVRAHRSKEGLALLQLNAAEYPESFGAQDSLGDAYLDANAMSMALQSYRRSLTLLPGKNNPSRPKLLALETRRSP